MHRYTHTYVILIKHVDYDPLMELIFYISGKMDQSADFQIGFLLLNLVSSNLIATHWPRGHSGFGIRSQVNTSVDTIRSKSSRIGP